MNCPYCSQLESKVIDSRLNQTGDITRRRRECSRCQGRFTTYERVEEVMPVVTKKDGRREAYDREKVLDGVRKACQKRPVTTQKIEELAARIERRIQSYGLKELPARTVGQMVMAELHQLDKVAYVRFASVYREFRDVEEFVAGLDESSVPKEDPSALMFPFAGENKQEPSPS